MLSELDDTESDSFNKPLFKEKGETPQVHTHMLQGQTSN